VMASSLNAEDANKPKGHAYIRLAGASGDRQ
jgi:hypothetical protein